ncbi:hypothetical protein [Peribacillus sp. RS7]|uniref:hypothetical protein n=1 Tax=Peribacillus sp. RS7 TaxID=3242679 RepID=UPI0035BFE5E8
MIIDPWGNIIGESGEANELLTGTLDFNKVTEARNFGALNGMGSLPFRKTDVITNESSTYFFIKSKLTIFFTWLQEMMFIH